MNFWNCHLLRTRQHYFGSFCYFIREAFDKYSVDVVDKKYFRNPYPTHEQLVSRYFEVCFVCSENYERFRGVTWHIATYAFTKVWESKAFENLQMFCFFFFFSFNFVTRHPFTLYFSFSFNLREYLAARTISLNFICSIVDDRYISISSTSSLPPPPPPSPSPSSFFAYVWTNETLRLRVIATCQSIVSLTGNRYTDTW